jgi:hypothetical protein
VTYARLRRASIALLVAVVGVSPAIVTSVAAASPAASQPHGTICVGLVVDPRSIGGSVSDTCVNVKPGTTGVGVLEAAGHALTFRKDGLLCTIDGLPETGCGAVNDTHFWVYFHRAPDRTAWTYATENESVYAPENRSTEGWAYDNGAHPAPRPDNIPAADICAALVKPAPSPARTTPRSHATRPPTPVTHPTPTVSIATARSASARHHRRATRAGASRGTVAGSAAAAVASGRSPTASPSPSGASPSVAASSGSSGRGSATGAVIAGVVIAALIAAAAIGARRRRT